MIKGELRDKKLNNKRRRWIKHGEGKRKTRVGISKGLKELLKEKIKFIE